MDGDIRAMNRRLHTYALLEVARMQLRYVTGAYRDGGTEDQTVSELYGEKQRLGRICAACEKRLRRHAGLKDGDYKCSVPRCYARATGYLRVRCDVHKPTYQPLDPQLQLCVRCGVPVFLHGGRCGS